jgi:DNA-binding CsgD family transcriptional regulator
MNTNTDMPTAVRRLHHAQNKSIKEISMIWGITETEVNLILNNKQMPKQKTASAKARDRRIVKLRREGMTQLAIAKTVGCSESTVQRTLGVRLPASQAKKIASKKRTKTKASKPVATQIKRAEKKTDSFVEYSILWGAFKFRRSKND